MNGADAALFEVELPAAPYPGLRPFETTEWPIFFGRERMADEVVERLQKQRLLVLHGDSGCGKSSLIRAGVLSRLEQEAARGGARWRTCIALPGTQPLWNLARALASLDGRGQDEVRVLELRRVLNFGRDAAPALSPLLLRDANDHVCILIDQFEELFAHGRHHGADEGRLLADVLIGLHALRPAGLYAALTMRSEFLGPCAQFPGFAETVNATQYLLPHMGRADLLRAIREPATLYGGAVELTLAERLVTDAGGGQDQLPLIQHGLMAMYREVAQSTPWLLRLETYRKSGGLQALLSQHADAIEQAALPAPGSRVIEDLFRAITEINPDGRALRRPQTFGHLLEVVGCEDGVLRKVLDAFRAEGVSFLRPYGRAPIGADTEIDISHEALIRCWDNLADPKNGWLLKEFRAGLVWRSLLVQAESYERNPSNLLSPATTEERQRLLQRRNASWAQRYGGGWARVEKLMTASLADARKAQAEKEAERERVRLAELDRQRGRMFRVWGMISTSLLVIAVGFAIWAWRSSIAADRASALYLAERDEARKLSDEQARTIETLQRLTSKLDTAAAAPGGTVDQSTIIQVQTELQKEIKQLNQSAQQSRQRNAPLAGYTVDVFHCAIDPTREKIARYLDAAIKRLGAGQVRYKSLDEDRRKALGTLVAGNQVRYDGGSEPERQAARSLISEPEFAAAGHWQTLVVSAKNATPNYLSVFVCPDPARSKAGY